MAFSWAKLKTFIRIRIKAINTNKALPKQNFYDLEATIVGGEKFKFSELKGKKVLIINTATKCGYTPQLALMEEINQKYKGKLTIIALPCNDFASQSPESSADISEFCSSKYALKVLPFEKVNAISKPKHQVYEWLSNANLNGWNNNEPVWNFCKYVIDEQGILQAFFNSVVKPNDPDLIQLIE